MKATQLRGMPVVSIDGAGILGEVEDLVLNPDAQRVVAIRVRLPSAGFVRTISGLDFRVGRDVLAIKDATSITEEDLAGVAGTVGLSRLLGARVMSHGGRLLGSIEEVTVDLDLAITGYELGNGSQLNLIGAKQSLSAGEGIHFVTDTLKVPDKPRATARSKEVVVETMPSPSVHKQDGQPAPRAAFTAPNPSTRCLISKQAFGHTTEGGGYIYASE